MELNSCVWVQNHFQQSVVQFYCTLTQYYTVSSGSLLNTWIYIINVNIVTLLNICHTYKCLKFMFNKSANKMACISTLHASFVIRYLSLFLTGQITTAHDMGKRYPSMNQEIAEYFFFGNSFQGLHSACICVVVNTAMTSFCPTLSQCSRRVLEDAQLMLSNLMLTADRKATGPQQGLLNNWNLPQVLQRTANDNVRM